MSRVFLCNFMENSNKMCTKCQQAKPLDMFNNDRTKADGKFSWCKICKSESRKDYGQEYKCKTCKKLFKHYKERQQCYSCKPKSLAVIAHTSTKICRKCFQEKNKTEFHRNSKYADGLTGQCKECMSRRTFSITCAICGETVSANSQKKFCDNCGIGMRGGYSKSSFKKKCEINNNGKGTFYVIKCFNDTESFYKLGVTSRNIEERFAGRLPYDYTVVKIVEDTADLVWDLEKKMIRYTRHCRYIPQTSFGGRTECFKPNIYVTCYIFNNL